MKFAQTFLLLAGLTALFMGIGYLIGGSSGAIIAFVIAAGMNFFAYWNSDSIVLKMSGAKVADQMQYRLFYDIVAEQTQKYSMPMPKLYVIDEAQPNAFATGRNPQNAAVAVTTGIWQLLSKEEISGVIAHELAHIKNRDTLISTIAATFAGAISMLANMLMFMNLFSNNSENRPHPVVSIAIMIVAPLVAAVLQMAVSRQREYAADKLGGEMCGNPLYLASALNKLESYARGITPEHQNPATAHMYIVNPFKAKGDSLFSTHPNTKNRVAQLQKQAQNLGIYDNILSVYNTQIGYRVNKESKKESSLTKETYYKDSSIKNNPWL